jgi:predicted dehydrogenase
VGKIRFARMTVSVDAFPPIMPGRYAWCFDGSNFSHVLSIYAGHFGDMLFHSVGFPKKLTAVVENQFSLITVEETGQKIPTTRPDEVMVIGTLEDGGLFSVQIEGGQRHRTGLQIDITGTEGVLKVTNPRAFEKQGGQLHRRSKRRWVVPSPASGARRIPITCELALGCKRARCGLSLRRVSTRQKKRDFRSE